VGKLQNLVQKYVVTTDISVVQDLEQSAYLERIFRKKKHTPTCLSLRYQLDGNLRLASNSRYNCIISQNNITIAGAAMKIINRLILVTSTFIVSNGAYNHAYAEKIYTKLHIDMDIKKQ